MIIMPWKYDGKLIDDLKVLVKDNELRQKFEGDLMKLPPEERRKILLNCREVMTESLMNALKRSRYSAERRQKMAEDGREEIYWVMDQFESDHLILLKTKN